jgi:hypothetical protein
MQTDAPNITIQLAPDSALNLADALDITVEFLEMELAEERQIEADIAAGRGDADQRSQEEKDRVAGLIDDLSQQIGAVRCAQLRLGRELPKHFPELSRAERRAKDNEEDC